ncbi:MAG: enoyl-CoA hydratase/isomerase family protein [Acidimicrobiia bacterium]
MDLFDIQLSPPVAVATMANDENRIDSDAIDGWNALLDTVETTADVSALVVTGDGRYWSTGLDLDYVGTLSSNETMAFMRRVDLVLGRLLTAPFITVAALNGHTYAAGALLALAHDYRVMRQDQGFFCLPSVDVGIPFSPGMSSMISSKLPQPISHDLVVSGRRIGGLEAAATGVVTRAVPSDQVLDVATEYAHAFARKDPEVLTTVKRRMYSEAASMLTVDP